MAYTIYKHRRGTSEEWLKLNLVPANGELVIEECLDGSRKCKIGDGITSFQGLPYLDDQANTQLLSKLNTLEQAYLEGFNKLSTTLSTEIGILKDCYIRFSNNKLYVGDQGSDEIVFDCGTAPTETEA